jgi:cytochrome-b5 reductase
LGERTPETEAAVCDICKCVGLESPTCAELDSPGWNTRLARGMIQYLEALPHKLLRVLPNTTALQLITTADEKVIGVRTRTQREIHPHSERVGTMHAAESNMFVDAVITCANARPLFETFGDDFDPKTREAVDRNGNKVPGLYIVNESLKPFDAISRASAAALHAVEIPSAHHFHAMQKRRELPQHVDYIDHTGVLHRTALRPERWTKLRLHSKFWVNRYNCRLRFSLPRDTDQAGFFAGQYIAVRAISENKKTLIRYYSPVSRNSHYGQLDLLIKIADTDKLPQHSMQYVMKHLQAGDYLDFKGPAGGLDYHRNTYAHVGMIAGGTGITPMMQIIRSVANHAEDLTSISLLYGSQTENDILCREELMYYSATRSNMNVHVALERPPAFWEMGSGFINARMISKHLPPPGDDVLILLCGPPPMIRAVKKSLQVLGYDDEMIFDYLDPPKHTRQRAFIARKAHLVTEAAHRRNLKDKTGARLQSKL